MGCTPSRKPNAVRAMNTFKDITGAFCRHELAPNLYVRTTLDSNYEVKTTLGHGTSSIVKEVVNRHFGSAFAVKSISKAKAGGLIPSLHREISILQLLDHPNIVRVHEVYNEKRSFHIVMDFCRGGELANRLKEQYRFTEQATLPIMRQLFYAVAYMHSKNILHLDLKPENILFVWDTPTSPVKIVDLGLAISADEVHQRGAGLGTPAYMAPEAIRGKYCTKTDMWSLGVIMFQLLLGYKPFVAPTLQSLQNLLKAQSFPSHTEEFKALSPHAQDLIRKLLMKQPKQRISASEALLHPWFGNLPVTVTQAEHPAPKQTRRTPVLNECTKIMLSQPNAVQESLVQEFTRADPRGTGQIQVSSVKSITFSQFIMDSTSPTDLFDKTALNSLMRYVLALEFSPTKKRIVKALNDKGYELTKEHKLEEFLRLCSDEELVEELKRALCITE